MVLRLLHVLVISAVQIEARGKMSILKSLHKVIKSSFLLLGRPQA